MAVAAGAVAVGSGQWAVGSGQRAVATAVAVPHTGRPGRWRWAVVAALAISHWTVAASSALFSQSEGMGAGAKAGGCLKCK